MFMNFWGYIYIRKSDENPWENDPSMENKTMILLFNPIHTDFIHGILLDVRIKAVEILQLVGIRWGFQKSVMEDPQSSMVMTTACLTRPTGYT